MLPAQTSWNDALTSARHAITSGRKQFASAAHSLADNIGGLQQGDPQAPERIAEEIVEINEARQTVRAGVALVRADREIGDEILSMVRRNDDARRDRDMRPDPEPGRRRGIDLLV